MQRRLMLKAAAAGLAFKDFPFECKAAADDSGFFEGYGSVFGNVDEGGDRVVKGAFADSLQERASRGKKLPVLWYHKGAEPIGVYEKVSEDERGLHVKGRLLVGKVQRATETFHLMKEGAVEGLSIGYEVMDGGSKWDSKTGVRDLTKLRLHEVSVVTFPMNTEATVETVKARALETALKSGRIPTLPEFEDFLCEAGFSKTQAKAIAGHGLSKLSARCEAEGKAGEVLQVLAAWKLPELPA